MARKVVDVAVIIPDASPVLTLARIGRIDLLRSFNVPVRIVDQVLFEITKPDNDPSGEVAAALDRLHNHIEIIETNVVSAFRRGGRAIRVNRAAILAISPWMSTRQCWRLLPIPILCRWCCSRTRT